LRTYEVALAIWAECSEARYALLSECDSTEAIVRERRVVDEGGFININCSIFALEIK